MRGVAAPVLLHLHHEVEVYAGAEQLFEVGPRFLANALDGLAALAEFIREKILRTFRDEVPHSIGVTIEHMEYEKTKNLNRILARIYVERDSQKGIIIGKGGQAIKRIGQEARADLEQLLGTRVYLDLMVKVKKNWRRDATQIRRFGYGEGL